MQQDTVDELSVIDRSSDLLDQANVAKINVSGGGGNESENGVDGDGGEDAGVLRDDLLYSSATFLALLGAELTLELKLVLAALKRLSRSLRSTGVEISSKYSTTFFAARPNDSAMMVGWIPLARSFSAAPKRDPARMTTEVVPSPASIS